MSPILTLRWALLLPVALLPQSKFSIVAAFTMYLEFNWQNSRVNLSPPEVHQVILSTAHPAKFSEAVTRALAASPSFDFEHEVLPVEFKGLLEKPRRVIDVPSPQVNLVKQVIVETLGLTTLRESTEISNASV